MKVIEKVLGVLFLATILIASLVMALSTKNELTNSTGLVLFIFFSVGGLGFILDTPAPEKFDYKLDDKDFDDQPETQVDNTTP